MHKHNQRCTDLIEVTADALSDGVVALMLMAVQHHNLEFSVKKAVKWLVRTYSDVTMKVCNLITGPMIFLRGVGAQRA